MIIRWYWMNKICIPIQYHVIYFFLNLLLNIQLHYDYKNIQNKFTDCFFKTNCVLFILAV